MNQDMQNSAFLCSVIHGELAFVLFVLHCHKWLLHFQVLGLYSRQKKRRYELHPQEGVGSLSQELSVWLFVGARKVSEVRILSVHLGALTKMSIVLVKIMGVGVWKEPSTQHCLLCSVLYARMGTVAVKAYFLVLGMAIVNLRSSMLRQWWCNIEDTEALV